MERPTVTPSLASIRDGLPEVARPADEPAAGGSAGAGEGKAAPGRAGERRTSFVAWFLLLSLASVAAVSMTSAYLMSRFVTGRMLTQDVSMTTEFVNHIFASDHADRYFHPEGTRSPELTKG